MTIVDLLGWVAAAFTLAAYSMRTMLPLRFAAIGANVCFIGFGYAEGALPILVLHCLLLPFNAYRLWELTRSLAKLRQVRGKPEDFTWLRDLATPARHEDGAYVFRKGDPPDNLYYLESGEVLLEEIDVTLSAGDIFGEIAFFIEAKERTTSARCVGPCRILAIDESRFMALYFQNPAFGLAIVQLIAKRLMDGIATRPEAYLPVNPVAQVQKPPAGNDT